MAKTLVNEISVTRKCMDAAKAPKFVPFYKNAASARLVAARENMLNEFDDHQVTKELKQDPSTPGSQLVGVKGNLVSYLGIENGKESAAEVREFLRENTDLTNEVKIRESKNKIHFDFKVKVPSKTQVYEAFPTPDGYSSRSFLQIIDDGLTVGLRNYIFWWEGFRSKSRSGTGLEAKGPAKNPATFTGMKYISEIINNFIAKFK